mgnify:CR=1
LDILLVEEFIFSTIDVSVPPQKYPELAFPVPVSLILPAGVGTVLFATIALFPVAKVIFCTLLLYGFEPPTK